MLAILSAQLDLFFFFHPIYCLLCSLSLLVVTQIRGHIAGSFPPLPTTVRALHFYHEKISALPSPTRVELCLPTLGALTSDPFLFLQAKSKFRHDGIRTHGPTLVAFEGYL